MENPSPPNLLAQLERTLSERFSPIHLEVLDDSGRHRGHSGNTSGGGHYQVTLVSDVFQEKSLMEQHRMVHEALKPWMGTAIHALALKTLSPSQWNKSE